MDTATASKIAQECGYEVVGPLEVSGLVFRDEVRAMCNKQQCPTGYDSSWSCPPAMPPLEEQRVIVSAFSDGVVVQTIGQMEDEFDFETIQETSSEHNKRFLQFAKKMRAESTVPVLPLGAGCCDVCPSCTYPDDPCRYPDEMISSMEGSGLLVSEVCTNNGFKYNNGKNTITFTSCCLF